MIWKTTYGNPFETFAITQEVKENADVKYLQVNKTDAAMEFQYTLAEKDIVYGLGETTRGLNKRGGRYISFNTDTANHSDENPSIYSSHNFIIIDGSKHFGIFFDTPAKVTFEIDYEDSGELKVICETQDLRVYLVEHENSYEITKEFLRGIGQSYIPPLWAFGYGQSRFGYKTQKDFFDVIDGHEKAGVPLDYVCMDIDYMEKYKDFTVNQETFPDLQTFIDTVQARGIHLVPITDAGVKVEKGYSIYEEGVEKDYFCTNKKGKYFKAGVWPGMTHFPDFLNPKAREWFGNQYRYFTEKGVEGFWNDMNEPAIFYSENTKGPKRLCFYLDIVFGKQREAKKALRVIEDYKSFYHQVDGKKIRHYDVHNIYGAFMTMAVSEQLDKLLDHRFMLFARSSYIGSGRYGGLWTGDNSSCWEHLKLHLVHMQSLNMCGFLYSGADIGGFMGKTTRELLIRWLAFAVFVPLMRNHSGFAEQECYQFEKVEEFRDVVSLRYRLLPYIYSEYMKAALKGDMYIKPLAFAYPEDEKAREIDDQILVGESIMAAPVLEEGAKGREIYLPEDMTMVRYNGKEFTCTSVCKGSMFVEVALNEVVFFILKDKLVPVGKELKNSSEMSFEDLTLLGDGSEYSLYEDDGMTKTYSLDNIKILKK